MQRASTADSHSTEHDLSSASNARTWLTENAPLVLLGVALLASAALLVALTVGLTYFQDTWEFLMGRREFSADALLQPHNEHIVLFPVAIELLLLKAFGMSSALPEYVLLIAALLVTAILIFVYVRRRIGPWLALMAAVALLFLGPAWQDLLWPFELGFVCSILFGVAMLLALDYEERRWDIAACVFLALSLGFPGAGVAFAVGAGVDVLQKVRTRGWKRLYIPAIPLLLFGLWWLGWGHDAENHLSLHNALASPVYIMEGLAASVAALLGLSSTQGAEINAPVLGRPLLVAVIALVVVGQVRKPGIYSRFWPVAATTVTFWFLAAFNFIQGREAYTSRYLYLGAAFILLLGANLLKGVRVGKRGLWACGIVTLVAVASNLAPLNDGADWLEGQTELTRADLAAIEISSHTVEPSFGLTPEIAGTPSLIDILAGEYLTAVDEYGSPAYTPDELASASEAARYQADVVLAHALPVTTEIQPGVALGADDSECSSIPAGAGLSTAPLPLRPGMTRIAFAVGGPGTIRLRRFATGKYPLVTEGIGGESTVLLFIPRDNVVRPWRLQVEAAQPVTICPPQ